MLEFKFKSDFFISLKLARAAGLGKTGESGWEGDSLSLKIVYHWKRNYFSMQESARIKSSTRKRDLKIQA